MLRDNRMLLSRLCDKHAVILGETSGGLIRYTAYPYGDRRRRPISWIRTEDFKDLLNAGHLKKVGKGYAVMAHAVQSNEHCAQQACEDGLQSYGLQHRNMETQSFSGPQGAFRNARVNRTTQSGLRTLDKRLSQDGERFFTGAQINAGEAFTHDYARAAYGKMQTQNYMSIGLAKHGRENSAEDISIAAMDSRKRLKAAKAYMGPGLCEAVMAICANDMGLEQLERAEGWARRSGKTILKLGLQRLVVFYGTAPGIAERASR